MIGKEDLTSAFEAHRVDAKSFGHKEHIRVAHDLLQKYDFFAAAAKYAAGMQAIAAKVGAHDKFNTTITIAFLSLIAERMKTVGGKNFEEFMANNTDLMRADILALWYAPERLYSDMARNTFLMPTIQ